MASQNRSESHGEHGIHFVRLSEVSGLGLGLQGRETQGRTKPWLHDSSEWSQESLASFKCGDSSLSDAISACFFLQLHSCAIRDIGKSHTGNYSANSGTVCRDSADPPHSNDRGWKISMPTRWAENQSMLARRFFGATIVQAILCGAIAWGLAWWFGPQSPGDRLALPSAFKFGTAFLFAGSWFLHVGRQKVRMERQLEFRRALLMALLFSVLFVSVQTFGLWGFVNATRDYQNPQLNTHGFVFMFAALHAMHFLVAQSVLLWVTLAAFCDRYDHEYYFGVTFANWFWHALGIAWLAILCVFSIAS